VIATALTEMFGLQHPIVLAPMGGVSGGHLAATVVQISADAETQLRAGARLMR
jgi:NAD(P)H-dependent flavin oxidoreductase YrpB (nitropropane dioxygenase family)